MAKTRLADIARAARPGIPLKEDSIAKLLEHYRGNISRVADKLGCNRKTVADRINRSPELTAIKVHCRERFIDNLEECAWTRALDGDSSMQIFLLKCLGKSRGYEFETSHQAQTLATAAFEFVVNQSKNPAIQQDIPLCIAEKAKDA
jgi:hypothetical protein